MKKFIFSAFAFALFGLNVAAEDGITIAPTTLTAGATSSAIQVKIFKDNYDDYVTQLQFDVVVPTGFEVTQCSRSTKLLPSYTEMVYDEEKEEDVEKTFYYHSSTYTKKDYGCRYTLTTNSTNALKTGNDNVATMKIKVDASVTPGIYPIYFKDIVFSGVDEVSNEPTTCVAYVKVGSPENVTFTVGETAQIPSLVNTALATETAISKLDLSAVTASNGTFTYVDKREVVAPTAEVTANVKYTRTVGAGNYASLCLPFAVSNITAYANPVVNGTNAKFETVTSLDANTSAIVEGDISIEQEAKLCAAANGKLTAGYYLKSGELKQVNGSVALPMFRGSWDLGSNDVKSFSLGDETVINGINADTAEDIYSVTGVKRSKTQRGVNIVGGKKILVK